MKNAILLGLAVAMATTVSAQNLTVMSSRDLPAGHKMQIVQDARGCEFRHLVKPAAQQLAPDAPSARINFEEPPVVTYYEGFEGYDESYGLNWLPEGWTRKNTPENTPTAEQLAHNINNTWYSYTSSNMFQDLTTDGTKEAFIHFGYANETYGLTNAAQDEWMITPSITLDNNKKETLQFLLQADYFDVYDCDKFDWSALTYAAGRTVVNTLKIMVSEDNGATWKCVWDLADDVCSKLTDKECYDASDLTLTTQEASLADYAGKTVKIGFRYVRKGGGFYGNSMIVDAVKVQHPASDDTDGVDGIKADTNAPAEYFTTDGVRLSGKPSQHGVYMQRKGGATRKVAL